MDADRRDELKRLAAEQAVQLVESGMVVGLGVGSTAIHAIRRIAALLESGALRDVVGVPCAASVEYEARALGIPLTTLDDCVTVDLTIDGADEVDPRVNLIKGGGGALLREKMVAQASRREVIVVDATKLSPALGTIYPLPLEIIPFGAHATARFVAGLGARTTFRRTNNGDYYRTDQGHLILDCAFGPIDDVESLALALERRAGIVEHGLFLGLATDLIVASEEGVRHITVSTGAQHTLCTSHNPAR
ncbi:MAG: ribose-5-phosphate isomerase RpiA [Chloroflexi bacterium]|nr:ribose-5-phosphate isomerase RpiA [Chloroflexota bacterium]